METLPTYLIAPLSIVSLSLLSFTVRWIGHFRLSYAGADLSLIAAALRLGLFFTKMEKDVPVSEIGLDMLLILFFIIFWALTLKMVQVSLEKEAEGSRWSGLYSYLAFFMGAFAVALQIVVG